MPCSHDDANFMHSRPVKKTNSTRTRAKNNKKQNPNSEADPFRLIVNSTADTVCFASYRGPHSVIYDEKLDCVTPIRGDSESNENVILSPAVAYCSDAIPFNESSHYWSRTECMPKPTIRDDDIIQIKSSNSYNFIYCASLQIVVFNRTFDCPSFVFSIPHFASFSIGRLHYRADNLQLAHVLKLAPVTSSRVNFHLLPKLPMFQLHDDIRQEIADLKNFTSLPEHHLIHHDHASLAIVVVLLLPMFIFFAFKMLHVLRRGSNTNARSSFSPRSERVELSKDVRGSLRTKKDNTPSSELEGNSNRSGQSRPSGQSSRFSSKQAALLCVLSLLLTPDVNAANCPHAVTLSIDTSFCSTIAPKDNQTCADLHHSLIEIPFMRICSSISTSISRHDRDRRSTERNHALAPLSQVSDIQTLSSLLPLVGMQVENILSHWNDNRVHRSLFYFSDLLLPISCISSAYSPLTCRYDRETELITMIIVRRPHFFSSMIDFFSHYSGILFILVVTTGAILLILHVRFIKEKRTHQHERLWHQSSDSSFLPPPISPCDSP